MSMRTGVRRFAPSLGWACLPFVVLGLSACPGPITGLTIINNNENVLIHAVYVSPVANRIEPDYPEHTDWGPNLIEGYTDLGYGTVVTITGIPAGDYDLLAVGAHTPQYGGSIVRYVEYDVSLTLGGYLWELLPTAKGARIGEEDAPGDS